MENMEKGLTVPKWAIGRKYPKCLKFICPSPNVWDFDEKRLHLASVVPDFAYKDFIEKYFLTFCSGFVIWKMSRMFDVGALTWLIFLTGLLIMDYYEKLFEQYSSLIDPYIYFP